MNDTSFKRVVIRFFSGTGNSFRVANWFLASARQAGAKTALIPITRGRKEEPGASDPETLFVLDIPLRKANSAGMVQTALRLVER